MLYYIYIVQLTHAELSRGELDDQIRRFDGASAKKGMGGPLGTGMREKEREGTGMPWRNARNQGGVRLVHVRDTRDTLDRLHPRQPQVRLAPSAPQAVVERDSEGVALRQDAFANNAMQPTRRAPGRPPQSMTCPPHRSISNFPLPPAPTHQTLFSRASVRAFRPGLANITDSSSRG